MESEKIRCIQMWGSGSPFEVVAGAVVDKVEAAIEVDVAGVVVDVAGAGVDVAGAVVGDDTSEVVIVDATVAVEEVVTVSVEDTALEEEDSGKAN